MKNISLFRLSLAAWLVFCPITHAQVEEIVEGEVFVTFREGATEIEKNEVLRKYNLKLIKLYEIFGYGLYQTNQETLEVISKLKKEPAVIQAGPNHFRSANAVPNDSSYASQWYLPKINWPDAWTEFTGSQQVIVAVVDSGVSKTHLQLNSALTSSGERDYYDNDNNAEDGFGHGTLVAGIIAAKINDGTGVAGICPKAKILPLRVFDNAGRFAQATSDAIASSLQQSILQGVKVVNLSLGSPGYNENERIAVSTCRNYGILVVCAAGNGGSDGAGDNNDSFPTYPSCYNLDNILSVAATDENDNLTSFSNYGAPSVHLAAPGQQILGCDIARKTLYNWTFDFGSEGWMAYDGNGYGWIRTQAFATYSGDAGITTFDWLRLNTGLYRGNSLMELFSPIITLVGQKSCRLEVQLGGYLGIDDYLTIEACGTDLSNQTLVDFLAYPGWNYQKIEKDVSVFDGQTGRAVIALYADLFGLGIFSSGQVGIQGVRITALDQGVSAGAAERSNSGTSFSAPMVSGVAAMLFSQNPSLTYSEVRQIILDKTRKVAALNGKVSSGGVLDAAAALREAKARIVVTPTITSSTSASATVGSAFTYRITASGAPTSYSASSLPSGLSVNTSTGVISGTPSSAGTFRASIGAVNGAQAGVAQLTITVANNLPTITSDLSGISVNLGSSFSYQIAASGSPTSFGAIRLPPGLKVNAKTGLISGKPTKAGVFSVTLQALKKGSPTATATKVFTVVQVPTFSYAARINAQRNKNVKVRPKVAGSPAPSFSVVSGSLPPGLSLNASTAAITGTPTTAGSYPFTVRGSNSAGNTDRGTTIVVK